jgi:glutamate carboxypeptidase
LLPSDLDLPAELFASTVAVLEEITAISSPSGTLAGLTQVAERLASLFRERGLRAKVSEEEDGDGRRLPVLRVANGAGDPASARSALLMLGHFDTVLEASPPHREQDKVLIATGAIDMKGGFAALLGALDLLAHRGITPPPFLLVGCPDEEVGGTLARALTRRHGRDARELWVLEPGEPASEGETMVAGRRGMVNWQLLVVGRAAHAGLAYWEGRSALAAAARWCVAAQDLSRPGRGPTVNVGRLVAGDASFVENLAAGAAALGTEQQLNVVPNRALAEGEARFLTLKDGEALRASLRSLAAEVAQSTGTEFDLAVGPTVPPVEPHALQIERCERVAKLAARRGWKLELERERGGISFPNFLPAELRIPVLDGLGPVGGGMHTRGEFVELASLARRVVLLADLLAEAAVSAPSPRH